MAKKKAEEAPKGSPAWMSTFSDLMNLLMCFFVLLFSMSSVDESKAEALIKSLADTFSIFEGGGSSFEEGVLISSGSSQLSNLDEYYNQSGQTDNGDDNTNVNNSTDSGSQGTNGSDSGSTSDSSDSGSSGNSGDDAGNTADSGDNSGNTSDSGDDAGNTSDSGTDSGNSGKTDGDDSNGGNDSELQKDRYAAGTIYEEIIGEAGKYNIGDYIDVKVDSKAYEYIEIDISGSVLFDTESAVIKTESLSILSKVGDILKTYKGFKIEIIGHTDNMPLSENSEYINNDILSAARAIAVGEYFAETKLMGWDNIFCVGRGDHDCIKDNSTAEGRAANRRVEIRLYNNKAE